MYNSYSYEKDFIQSNLIWRTYLQTDFCLTESNGLNRPFEIYFNKLENFQLFEREITEKLFFRDKITCLNVLKLNGFYLFMVYVSNTTST